MNTFFKFFVVTVLVGFGVHAKAQTCAIANAAGVWGVYGEGLGASYIHVKPDMSDPTQTGKYTATWHLPNGMSSQFEGDYGQDPSTGNCILDVDVILPGGVFVLPSETGHEMQFSIVPGGTATPGTPRLAACDIYRGNSITDNSPYGPTTPKPTVIDGPYPELAQGTNELDRFWCRYTNEYQETQPVPYVTALGITYCVNENGFPVTANNCAATAEPEEVFVPIATRVDCRWPLDYNADGTLAMESSDEACRVWVDVNENGQGGTLVNDSGVVIQRSTLQQ